MNETASRSPLPVRPFLFERQRRLLALLDAFGGSLPKVDLQPLLFLWCQADSRGDSIEFVPYLHGAFSFTAGAHLRRLVERGLVKDDGSGWILTPEGKRAVGGAPDRELVSFARRHRDLRGDALVARTYRMFPYYATRSEIAERVLGGDPEALQRIEDERPVTTPAALFTIGYEGRSLEGYLNALLGAGVTILCDVRRNPLSRKYGFSKTTLSSVCVGIGLRYEHLPELGIAADRRTSSARPATTLCSPSTRTRACRSRGRRSGGSATGSGRVSGWP